MGALRLASAFAFARGQAFATGWFEGVMRHKAAGPGGQVIPGSRFASRSVEYAASQAAVAYCIAMEPPAEGPN